MGSDTYKWDVGKNQEILDAWCAHGDAAIRILLASCDSNDLSNDYIKEESSDERSLANYNNEAKEETLERYKTLFITWCAMATQRDQWIKPEKLPSMFRFALQRPLLPESVLQSCTRILGLTERLEWLWPDIRNDQSVDREIQRSVYVDPNPVSRRFIDVLQFGLESLKDESYHITETVESAGLAVDENLATALHPPDKEAGETSITAALHQLYKDIEAGRIPLAEASRRYGEVIGEHPQTRQALARLLVSHGLFPNHLPRSGSIGRTFGNSTHQKLQFIFQEIEDHETIDIALAKTWYERVLGGPHNLSRLADRLADYGLPSSHLEGRFEKNMQSEESLFLDDSCSPQHDTGNIGLLIDSNEYRKLVTRLETAIVKYRAEKMEFDELFRIFRVALPGLPYDDVDLSEILTNLDSTPQETASDLATEISSSAIPPGSGQTKENETKYYDLAVSSQFAPVSSIEKSPSLSDKEKDLIQITANYIDLYRKGEIDSQALLLIAGKDLPGLPWSDEYLSEILHCAEESSDELARLLVIQTFSRSSYDGRSDGSEVQALPCTRNTTVDTKQDNWLSALSATIEAFRSSQIDIGDAILKIRDNARTPIESKWLADILINDQLTTEEAARDMIKYFGLGLQVPVEAGHQAGRETLKKEPILHLWSPKKPVIPHARIPTPVYSCPVSIDTQTNCSMTGVSQDKSPGTTPPELHLQDISCKQRSSHVHLQEGDGGLYSEYGVDNVENGRTSGQGDTTSGRPGAVPETEPYSTAKKPSGMAPPSTDNPASHRVRGSADSRSRREGAPAPESSRASSRRSGTPRPRLHQLVIPYTSPEIAGLEQQKEMAHPETCGDLQTHVQPKEWKEYLSGSAGHPVAECYDPSMMSTSPEDCTTEDLFGLDMPTEKARSIGYKLELPPEYVQERIRSKTPNRVKHKKLMKVKSTVTLPSPKRQASRTLSEEHDQKLARLRTNDIQFAFNGEDNYAFIRRRLTPALMDQAESLPPRSNKKKKKKQKKGDALNTSIHSLKVPAKSHIASAEPAFINTLDTPNHALDVSGSADNIKTGFSNHEKTDAEEAEAKPRHNITITELLNDEPPRQTASARLVPGYGELGTEHMRESFQPSLSTLECPVDGLATHIDNSALVTPSQNSGTPTKVSCLGKHNPRCLDSSLASCAELLEEKYNLEREKPLIFAKLRRNSATHTRPGQTLRRRALFVAEGEKESMTLGEDLATYSDRWRRVRTSANDDTSNRYFSNTGGGTTNQATALNRMFDRYRDDPKDFPDLIGVTGTMHYLTDLNVPLDQVVVLAVLTELQAPTMGELTRQGFLDCWSRYHAETLDKQKATISSLHNSLTSSSDFFSRVYKHTFVIARPSGQRAVPLDAAIEYWRLLFQKPSIQWSTPSTPWMQWWIEFLETNYKRSVGKDMWDQMGVFVRKCGEDESLGWWSEDGAWPSVVDDFVAFVREKRAANERMEVE